MPADNDTAPGARRCGYSQCAMTLVYDGRGRPPEYCADRRWADGRTCKQMAAAERAGERAIGLDLPLEAFRAAGERLTPQLRGLAEQLTGVAQTIDAVRDGAMDRIGVAEQEAAAAGAAQREAAQARDAAIAAMTSAVVARDEALAAAEKANSVAEDAVRQAEQRIAAAWEKASAADRARGAAEEAATRAGEAQRAAVAELAEANATRAKCVAEAETARTQLRAVEERAMAMVAQIDAAQAKVNAESRRADGAEQVLAVIREERQETLDQLATLRDQLTVAQAEISSAVAGQAAAMATGEAATARALAAERRLDAMVGLLSARAGGPARLVGLDHVIETSMVDSPFHRYPDGADLAGLPLGSLADLPVVVVRLPEGRTAFEPDMLPRPSAVAGAAVLLATGWDRFWGTPEYGVGAPYLTGAAARRLADAGAALVGIDSVDIDEASGGERPAHSVLLAAGIPVLEHLTGLDQVPQAGARLHAVPPRVHGFGTFPVRVYVVIPS